LGCYRRWLIKNSTKNDEQLLTSEGLDAGGTPRPNHVIWSYFRPGAIMDEGRAGAPNCYKRKWPFSLFIRQKCLKREKSIKIGVGAITVQKIKFWPLDLAWADPTAGAKSHIGGSAVPTT